MKFKVDDKVSIIDTKTWDGYGFENSTVTKSWVNEMGSNMYSILSHKGHKIYMIQEKELKNYEEI